MLTPKAPGWVVPGVNSAVPEEKKRGGGRGSFSEVLLEGGPGEPRFLVKAESQTGGGEVEGHEGQRAGFPSFPSNLCGAGGPGCVPCQVMVLREPEACLGQQQLTWKGFMVWLKGGSVSGEGDKSLRV